MKIEKYKLKNGENRYRFQIALPRDEMTGKRRTTRRSGFKTREQAKIALSRIQSKIERDGSLEPKKSYRDIRTFGDVYREWLVIYKEKVKPTTYYDKTRKVKQLLLPTFENLDIAKIKAPMMQSFIIDLSKKYKEFHSITTAMRAVFKYAYKMNYIDHNEFDKVEIPKEKRNTHRIDEDVLTVEELKNYLRRIHDNYSFENYAYFTLLARTGMRRSEALALSWSDLKGDKLHIHRTVSTDYNGRGIISETTKTKSADRVIILDKKTLSILNEQHLLLNNYLTSHHFKNKHDLMFLSFAKGKPTQHVSSWPYGTLRRLQKKFPTLKKIDVHAFRHTYATLSLEAGMDLRDLQHQLGHSSYNTTLKYYSKYTKNQKQKAAQKMADFFDANNV